MRTLLAVVAILQIYNVRTIGTTNICIAAELSPSSSDDDGASSDTTMHEPVGSTAKAAATSSNKWSLFHNDATEFDELFRVQSCPSRCLAIQEEDAMQGSNLRKTSMKNFEPDSSRYTVRIFYLILIHNRRSANDALYLFRAIRDPQNIIVIHFDKKVDYLLHRRDADTSVEPLPLLQEIQACSCGSKVQVESVHSVEWSKWSMNLPTLWGMELASSAQYVNEWDIFINLSGDTIPVHTSSTMASLLNDMSSYNFVTSRSCETGLLPTNVYTFPKQWHKRRHYTHDETEADPVFTYRNINGDVRNKTIVTHFGSQWIILQNEFLTWLMNQLRDENSWPSQYRKYLAKSGKLMTDETFIPSILMHVNLNDDGIHPQLPKVQKSSGRLIYQNGTLSNIYHVRYERMDEHYPTSYGKFPSIQHYQVPESYIQQSLLDQPKIWGPYFLGTYDLGNIRDSGAFFARKVSGILDRNMLTLLPVDRAESIPPIYWPTEVSIIPRPDWLVEQQLWTELHPSTHSVTVQRMSQQETSSIDSRNDDDEEL